MIPRRGWGRGLENLAGNAWRSSRTGVAPVSRRTSRTTSALHTIPPLPSLTPRVAAVASGTFATLWTCGTGLASVSCATRWPGTAPPPLGSLEPLTPARSTRASATKITLGTRHSTRTPGTACAAVASFTVRSTSATNTDGPNVHSERFWLLLLPHAILHELFQPGDRGSLTPNIAANLDQHLAGSVHLAPIHVLGWSIDIHEIFRGLLASTVDFSAVSQPIQVPLASESLSVRRVGNLFDTIGIFQPVRRQRESRDHDREKQRSQW
mmetsp:Transcript_111161/g.166501  ORF Transcript_111161/g.166501 Transcript_111161/m.166501 type:complete len:267 (-) Transcript_111161:24-824(-)